MPSRLGLRLRRFKRTCEKAGVVADVRAREFYMKSLPLYVSVCVRLLLSATSSAFLVT